VFLLVPAHPGGPGQRALKTVVVVVVCVCVCVCVVVVTFYNGSIFIDKV